MIRTLTQCPLPPMTNLTSQRESEEEMRVKGELKATMKQNFGWVNNLGREEAEIELPPVDIQKIKEGDEVWVRVKVQDNAILGQPLDRIDGLVAHFPAEKSEPRKIEPLHEYDDGREVHPNNNEIVDKINEIIRHLNNPNP